MNYKETRQYIQAVQTGAAIQPGLETISLLLSWLQDPQDNCTFIHLAGTNGKGSTGTFITNVLAQSGRKVGRYFSPALFSMNETIQWNQEEHTHQISEEEYETWYVRIGEAIRKMEAHGQPIPTDFEIETALAFFAFSEWKCDIVVLETGMGGALDATNVVKNVKCNIITTIATDHKKFLGDTIEKIAIHKAGIITNDAPVITVQEAPEALEVIQKRCEKMQAPLHILDKKEITSIFCQPGQTSFCYGGETYTIRMCGQYQVENACLALLALHVLETFPRKILEKGMAEARWPGRFDFLRKHPVWIADGAHNLQGIESLLSSLWQLYPEKNWIGIMGVFADKDHDKMCHRLAQHSRFEKIFTIRAPGPRGFSAKKLKEELQTEGIAAMACDSLEKAINTAGNLQKKEKNQSIVVCFGSLSFMKELYQDLNP
ncbi:MAG: bifunctional folylpolyglutamate synthase/dihydrofolate synthase [Eubacterium sp.]